MQVYLAVYRMGLVLELSIASLIGGNGLGDIRRNEEELDRMYHLAAKIVSMALIQSETLQSSKIGAASLVPLYFLLCKKLENIGDTISYLAEYIGVKKPVFEGKKDILHFFVKETTRSIKYLPKVQKEVFKKVPSDKLEEMDQLIARVKDASVQNYLRTILRYVVDVEEEAVNISFYKQLIEDNAL